MRLDELPDEIVEVIAEHASEHDRRQRNSRRLDQRGLHLGPLPFTACPSSMIALMLASRKMCHLVHKRLYTAVDLCDENLACRFSSSLALNNMAVHVHSLKLTIFGPGGAEDSNELAIRLIEKCPQLRTLKILPSFDCGSLGQQGIKRLLAALRCLEQLRVVRIYFKMAAWSDLQNVVSMKGLRASVSRVELHLDGDDGTEYPVRAGLRTLKLAARHDLVKRREPLLRAIACAPLLQSLTLQALEIGLAHLIEVVALSQCSQTLQRLHLGASSHTNAMGPHKVHASLVNSLRLRHLLVSWHDLGPSDLDALPPSLETVTWTGLAWPMDYFEHTLRSSRLPRLKRFEALYCWPMAGKDEETQTLCDAVGIVLEWVWTPNRPSRGWPIT